MIIQTKYRRSVIYPSRLNLVPSGNIVLADGSWDAERLNQETNCSRQLIDSGQLTQNASTLTVGFDATQATESLRIDNAYIGHQAASGDAYDFDGSQVRITFNTGSNGFVISSGATITSDIITFSLDSTKNLIVSFDWTNNSDNAGSQISGATGFTLYTGTGKAPDASTTDATGYTLTGTVRAVVGQITKVS